MILRLRLPRVGSKPYLRVLSTLIAIPFIFFTSKWLLDSSGIASTKDLLLSLSGVKTLVFSTYHYEAPQDLVTFPGRGKSVESESLIAKVTILFHGKDPTYVRAIQSHQAHNRRFGYPLLVLRHAILDGIWSKPAYLLAILLEELRKPEGHRLTWLLYAHPQDCHEHSLTVKSWTDADTVVTNPKLPLEMFLPPDEFPHLHLLITADPNGPNNGIFFLKVHPWSAELLSTIIAYRTFRPDDELKFRDQSALQQILKNKRFRRNFVIVPQRWFNAYQQEVDGSRTLPFQILPGDLLVHFPGVPNRGSRMRFWLDRAERHLPEWEVDLQDSIYPNATKAFWADQLDVLAKERMEAQKFAEQATQLMAATQQQLTTHSQAIDSGELERVEKHVKQLKTALNDQRDDAEAIRDALLDLKKVGKLGITESRATSKC